MYGYEESIRYLRYTRKIGDYLQSADTSSVMILDHEHRIQVFEEDRRWDCIDSDKVYFHLKSPKSLNSPRVNKDTSHNGKQICRNFNNGNCYYCACKYAHVCLSCRGDHPRIQHFAGQHVSQHINPQHFAPANVSVPPPPMTSTSQPGQSRHTFRPF